MDEVIAACRAALDRPGRVLALTGAGVSAESGIPTFRGKDGYWTVGSTEYHPEELATRAAFERMPWDVWAWYLYRRGVCRSAEPNDAHRALVDLARAMPERFALITQNVDGLHRRAGSPATSTFAIHGDLERMRCADGCVPDVWSIPDGVPAPARGAAVPDDVRARLRCPRCGGLARPHVLWFDESYDDALHHLATTRRLAGEAALLLVAGTSAQTNLPWQIVTLARRAGCTIVDINVEDNPFGDIARSSGGVVRATAAAALPRLVASLAAAIP
jgi:NAD-dependent deacetylase